MALTEYEKRITVKRKCFAVKLYFLGSLDALSSDLLKFLCFKDRKPGEGPHLPPPLSQEKKLTDLHDLQKWAEKMWGRGDLSPHWRSH